MDHKHCMRNEESQANKQKAEARKAHRKRWDEAIRKNVKKRRSEIDYIIVYLCCNFRGLER